jgi:hypothetical protein
MISLKIFSVENKEFRVDAVVNDSEATIMEKIRSDADFMVQTIHDSIIIIPNELKKKLYFKLQKHAQS